MTPNWKIVFCECRFDKKWAQFLKIKYLLQTFKLLKNVKIKLVIVKQKWLPERLGWFLLYWKLILKVRIWHFSQSKHCFFFWVGTLIFGREYKLSIILTRRRRAQPNWHYYIITTKLGTYIESNLQVPYFVSNSNKYVNTLLIRLQPGLNSSKTNNFF